MTKSFVMRDQHSDSNFGRTCDSALSPCALLEYRGIVVGVMVHIEQFSIVLGLLQWASNLGDNGA